MTNDLLPCPFCGGSAHYNFTDAGADRKYYRVHCSKCDARIGHPYTGKDAAATAWNTRTPNKPAEVDLDALKREIQENFQSMSSIENMMACTIIDYLASSGHLATGKGGDAAPTQIDAAELEAAVEFRREMAEAARKRHDNFYGMNKDRPPIHDVILWEAARAHLQTLNKGEESA